METEIPKEILGLSKRTKVIMFDVVKPNNALKDIIGVVKAKKTVDMEKMLKEKGFEDAGKHLGV